jgi:hypothetical protein
MPGAPSVSRSSSVRRADPSKEHHSADEPSQSSPHTYSPPISPLAHRQTQKQKQRTPISSEPHSPTTMSSSMESLEPTPRARRRPPPRATAPLAPPHLGDVHSHPSRQETRRPNSQLVHRASDQYSYTTQRPHLHNQGSRTSLHQQALAPPASPNQIAHPRPSRAGAYLRHMASAPNMPKRPNSTPAHPPARRTTLISDSDTDDASRFHEYDEEPPLPRTWLESVARAVLFGGMGAYVGGPSNPPSIVEPVPSASHGKSLRPTRSSLSQASPHRVSHLRPHKSRSGLSDRTSTTKFTSREFLAPPELFTRIERGRSGKSTGEVTKTRVVCRSAPASRNNSRVRAGSRADGEESREKRSRPVEERKGRGHMERNKLPSLASTQAEGDAWTKKRSRVATTGGGNRYLSGWGVEPDSDDDGDDKDRQSSSEDDEELDLARILVPPKRQNSIKSLRKHLVGEDAGSSAAANLMKAASGRGVIAGSTRGGRSESIRQSIREDGWDGNEAEEWGRGWVRQSGQRRNSEDDDEETYAGFLANGRSGRSSRLGSGRSGTGKSRLGLPGPWGLIGGGS